MGFLQGLGRAVAPVAGIAAAGLGGFQQDQEDKVKTALAATAAKRQQDQDALTAALGQANLAHLGAETANLNAKPATPAEQFDPADFTVDGGKPQRGSFGKTSHKYLDAAGNPVTGAVAPYEKPPTPPANKLTPHSFMVDGKPAEGFVDEQGNAFDQSHQPIKGVITPYEPPRNPDTAVVTTGSGKDGDPAVTQVIDKSKVGVVGNAKGGAAGGGGGSLSPTDRARMQKQMEEADGIMARIERRATGEEGKPLNFGTLAGAANELSGAEGKGIIGAAERIGGNALSGAMDPDIQAYQTAEKLYADAATNLQSKRFTDSQLALRRSFSNMHGNDLASTIKEKQQLRKFVMQDPGVAGGAVAPTTPVGGRSGGAGGGTPQARTPLSDASKARAKTDPAYAAFLTSKGYSAVDWP